MKWLGKNSRRVLACLLFLLVAAVLGGCLDDEPDYSKGQLFANAYKAEDSWLVYWYVCGTDLESGLGAATEDISELLKTELPENVRVLIQTGGGDLYAVLVKENGAVGGTGDGALGEVHLLDGGGSGCRRGRGRSR